MMWCVIILVIVGIVEAKEAEADKRRALEDLNSISFHCKIFNLYRIHPEYLDTSIPYHTCL